MKKIKLIIALLSFIIIRNEVNAQGFSFDKEDYVAREVVENTRGSLPSRVSLKSFAPIIYPQESGNCVAQSFANAMSILIAKEKRLYDAAKITLYRPSPFFMYYSLKDVTDGSCEKGLDAEKAANFLLENGAMLMMGVEYPNYYPFTSTVLCDDYPPSYIEDKELAKRVKPSNIYRIETLADIKVALANGMPVVIGMMVPESFIECKTYVWSPSYLDKIDNSYGHAMTVIGYDDNLYGGSFEIMNSWGEDWGVNGFTRIKYKDAINWILAGWALERDFNTTQYQFKGDIESKKESETKFSEEIVKIFSEARNDTLTVNPFFQRKDLSRIFNDLGAE